MHGRSVSYSWSLLIARQIYCGSYVFDSIVLRVFAPHKFIAPFPLILQSFHVPFFASLYALYLFHIRKLTFIVLIYSRGRLIKYSYKTN